MTPAACSADRSQILQTPSQSAVERSRVSESQVSVVMGQVSERWRLRRWHAEVAPSYSALSRLTASADSRGPLQTGRQRAQRAHRNADFIYRIGSFLRTEHSSRPLPLVAATTRTRRTRALWDGKRIARLTPTG